MQEGEEGVSFRQCERRSPKDGAKREKIPWILRFSRAWQRELAARYFCGTFHFYNREMKRDERGELPKVVESVEERAARKKLRVVHRAKEEYEGSVKRAIDAQGY